MTALKKKVAAKAKSEPIVDLRGTLEWLRSEGDLIESDREVDPNLEIIALRQFRAEAFNAWLNVTANG